MTERIQAIAALQAALKTYQKTANGRHYEDLSREEQTVETLAQALYMRLEVLKDAYVEGGPASPMEESPKSRLANKLINTAIRLHTGGPVDRETGDLFEQSIEAFDIAADLKRQAETVKDTAETAAIRAKRNRS